MIKALDRTLVALNVRGKKAMEGVGRKFKEKKVSGEGHFVAVIIVIAVVAVIGVYFKDEIFTWAKETWAGFKKETSGLFSSGGTVVETPQN